MAAETMTEKQVEEWRDFWVSEYLPDDGDKQDAINRQEINALCDLALTALRSQAAPASEPHLEIEQLIEWLEGWADGDESSVLAEKVRTAVTLIAKLARDNFALTYAIKRRAAPSEARPEGQGAAQKTSELKRKQPSPMMFSQETAAVMPNGAKVTNVYDAYAEGQREALERAAKVCESVNNSDNPMTAQDCADAIRALLPSAGRVG